MLNGLGIPNDLAACQALLAELAQGFAADPSVVENHLLTIKSHEAKLQSQELTIQTHELTIASLADRLAERNREIAEQKLTIDDLLRRAFAQRSERYLDNPDQLRLDFRGTPAADAAADAAESLAEALAQASAAEEVVVLEHTRRKHPPRKPRSEQLPAHLPRYEVTLPVPDAAQTCPTHGVKKLIGHDRLETLEFERPKLKVRVTVIPKYACEKSPACGVTEASRPEGLVEGNRYDTSVAAEIVAAKFGFHLPIYRQQDLFAGSGWTPSRGTLLNIAEAAGDLLPPFIDFLRSAVLASGVVGTDDTRVTLLLPAEIPAVRADDPKSRRMVEVFTAARSDQKPSVTARMWAYRSVPWKLSVFDFTVSRHRDGPDQFLIDSQFSGTLLADCYAGYQGITLRSDSRITRAACHAHARRKLFDARDNHPLLASQFLALYQQLYDVEDRARTLSSADRQTLRDSDARPIWKRMRDLLDSDAAKQVLPKEKIAEALGYLRNHWDALSQYLCDGRVPIDNNEVEQLMKQVAIGRKNWLFLGSVSAGERAANFLTLVSSALRNDLDVSVYLKAVFDALLIGSTDYAALRPDHWASAHPEAIRVYRQAERRDRYARKTARRAERRLATTAAE